MGMAQLYQPPKQSRFGQLIDAAVILIMVFAALYIPIELELAGAEKGDWLPGTVTVEQGADGATVLKNDRGLVKTVAADGTVTFENLTWESLDQNATMQAQWGKLGFDLQGAAEAITKRYDYSFDWLWLVLTLAAIGGYFWYLVTQSDKEYRQVIAEKFGNRS
jgi:hypothetical protein